MLTFNSHGRRTIFHLILFSRTFAAADSDNSRSHLPFICATNWATGRAHLQWRYLSVRLQIYRPVVTFSLFTECLSRLEKRFPLVVSVSIDVPIIFPFAQNQDSVGQCWNRCLLWQCVVALVYSNFKVCGQSLELLLIALLRCMKLRKRFTFDDRVDI